MTGSSLELGDEVSEFSNNRSMKYQNTNVLPFFQYKKITTTKFTKICTQVQQVITRINYTNMWREAEQGQRKSSACTEHSLDLQDFVGAPSNSTKEEGTFPSQFCNLCYTRLRNMKKASKDGLPFHPIVAMEWSPHQDGCRVRD